MRCIDLSALSRKFFRPVSLALAGMLCFEAEAVFAQPPGGPLERPQEGGFRRGGFGRGDSASLSSALRDEKFVEKVALTEDQKKKLEQIRMDMFTAFRSGASREEMPNIMKEFEQKAVDVLTAEQKQIWEVRKEELKAESATREAERGGPGRERGPGGERGPGSSTPPSTPRRTDFVDEKPPEGAKVTASFGTRVADASAVGGDVPNPSDDKADGPKLKFTFRYAPWADVLKLFSEAANLTLDLNDVPPGTFNYYDEKTYTVTEALDVLNGYLLPKGFVLIRRDRFLVSLNMDNGIPPNSIPTITIEELPQRGANELLNIVIPLENLEADKIVGEVKSLTSPFGTVSALKNTNSLVLMDTGGNIHRIYRLLKAGGLPPDKETQFRAISLKHITAVEAERTVRRLYSLNTVTTSTNNIPQMGFSPFGGGFGGPFGGFGQPGFPGGSRDGRDGRGDDSRGRDGGSSSRTPTSTGGPTTPSAYAGKIQVTADTRTNHLLVTASATLVKAIEELVKIIDVDTDGNGNKIVRNESPAYLKAYLVPGGDVTQVSRTLNTMMPGLVVGEDTRSGKIHIHGTKEEHNEIEKLVQTLAGDGAGGGAVAVINLTRLDPIQATNTLKNLFLNDPRAPMIEPDAFGRRLLVRATADQLAQVKILLSQLGEAGGDPQQENTDRGNTRTLNLRGHDPQDILPLIEKMWEAGNRNSIRVVVPSQASPIRDRRVPSAKSDGLEMPLRGRGVNPIDQSAGEGRSTLHPVPTRDTAPPHANIPRRTSILQVSRSGQARETADDAPSSVTSSTTDAPEAVPDKATEKSADQPADSKEAANEAPPVGVTIRGDEVIITSEDKEALNRFENMYEALVAALPNRTRWTIFYLRTADATETAQMLERLFPQSSVTASTSSSDGLFGSLTSGLSTVGRGMMNVTGLNQTLGGGGSLRIITDARANALFVTGPQDTIREVEQMLEILDLAELPTDSLRDRTPRSIPVEFAEVDDVLEIVESVFKDAITPEQQGPGGQGQRFNPLAMLMGGAGGGGGGAGGRKQSGPELAVTADRRTSHLIVFCNDAMFKQVDGLVQSIDERARDARQTVRIMRLETADPALVSSTLTSLIPKVTVSASKGGKTRKKPGDPETPGAQPGQQAPDATRDAEMLRRAMEQRSQGRPGGGGFPGGGSPGGGGGGFPGGGSGRRGGR